MKVIKNMSFEEYRALDLINKSHLSNFVPGGSPRQALYSKETKSLTDGTAFHSVMEHGIEGNPEIVVSPYPDFRTKDAKAWKAAREDEGKIIVKQEFIDRLTAARGYTVDLIKSQIGLDVTDGKGDHELTVVTDTEKIRLDYTRDEAHFDWKTVSSAHPAAVYKDIELYNYDLQSYYYSKVYHEVTGEWRPFVFAFQELKPPFNCVLVQISQNTPEAWALAKSKYDQAYERMKSTPKHQSYTETMLFYEPSEFLMQRYNVEINPFN